MMVIKLKQAMSLLRINKLSPAFTLIESLITLTIVCIVLLLPTINYHQQLELQQEKLALLAFQSNWHNWINDSFLYHEVRIISVNQQTHCLKFIDPITRHVLMNNICPVSWIAGFPEILFALKVVK